jgi:hypothetical protein
VCTEGDVATYKKQFEVDCGVDYTFDATPSTIFMGQPGWSSEFHFGLVRGPPGEYPVEQLRTLLGKDMKFIMLIRDPVDFINSWFGPAYWYDSNQSVMKKRSCIAEGLISFFKFFPREHFLLMKSEDYFIDRKRVLNRTCNFLGVDFALMTKLPPRSYGRRRSTTRQNISFGQRKAFHADPYNRKCREGLEKMTGMKFDWPGVET